MGRIIGYNTKKAYDTVGLVDYMCDACNVFVRQVVKLEDDCVRKVEIMCPDCGDTQTLYLLVCKTESKSRELLAEMNALRITRG